MNIHCDKNIENLDNSEDDYRRYTQNIVILKLIQKIFCEMIIVGRNIAYTYSLFDLTIVRENV